MYFRSPVSLYAWLCSSVIMYMSSSQSRVSGEYPFSHHSCRSASGIASYHLSPQSIPSRGSSHWRSAYLSPSSFARSSPVRIAISSGIAPTIERST